MARVGKVYRDVAAAYAAVRRLPTSVIHQIPPPDITVAELLAFHLPDVLGTDASVPPRGCRTVNAGPRPGWLVLGLATVTVNIRVTDCAVRVTGRTVCSSRTSLYCTGTGWVFPVYWLMVKTCSRNGDSAHLRAGEVCTVHSWCIPNVSLPTMAPVSPIPRP
jgi:hypothetical protein